ncbi:MFS transporter [Marinovum sp. 2_MG-2023]|uniref:MFS transporter n=1 Tax=unclassified Marinovum TaxID=2647166 RepID=UPI0026E46206|nr:MULTISPECIES: MFS transporter [unclassified Marinovum]MDO6730720.1 MFS transporter [Marinovum sp. 2_MG-2023]MDO6780075.1 MFS transporter [Marinovum sp. 1_MG-2023]
MISRDDIAAARAPLACFMTVGLVFGAFAAQVPAIKARIDVTDGMFGICLLVAASGSILAMWLAPRLDMQLGQRTLAALGLVAGCLVVSLGIATGPLGFALAMFCVAAASGALDVIMNARVSAIEARRARPLMNFAHATFSMAYAVAALVSGVLREGGWSPIAVFALLAVVNLGLVRVAMGDRAAPLAEDSDEASHLPAARGLLLLGGLVILVGFMAENATEGWSALHLERTLGGGAAEGALGPAILGATMALGRLGGQAMVSRFSEVAVMAIAAAVAAFGAFVAGFANGLTMAYIGFATLGVGVSVVAPMAFSHVGRNVRDRVRTAAIARISMIGYTGFFIGPPIMGFVSEAYGLRISFVAMGGALLIITCILAPLLAAGQRRRHAG